MKTPAPEGGRLGQRAWAAQTQPTADASAPDVPELRPAYGPTAEKHNSNSARHRQREVTATTSIPVDRAELRVLADGFGGPR